MDILIEKTCADCKYSKSYAATVVDPGTTLEKIATLLEETAGSEPCSDCGNTDHTIAVYDVAEVIRQMREGTESDEESTTNEE